MPLNRLTALRLLVAFLLAAFAAVALAPIVARADADEAPSANASTLGLQPIRGPIPVATPAPGESRTFRRPDGAFQAIPQAHGRVKVFHIVERAAGRMGYAVYPDLEFHRRN